MNFRRRRPRQATASSHRWDWSTWKAWALRHRIFRQGGKSREQLLRETYEEEAAMWERYLEEFGKDEENW